LCAKVFCEAFLHLQFRLVIFCRREIGKKSARKMLVKLTRGRKKSSRKSATEANVHLGKVWLNYGLNKSFFLNFLFRNHLPGKFL